MQNNRLNNVVRRLKKKKNEKLWIPPFPVLRDGLTLQVGLGLNLKSCDLYFETWRELVSGQIATSIVFLHSKKCLIGGFLPLEIFFRFPLLTALSVIFPFNDQHRVCDANFF
ncbi:hypothetical protein RIF29_36572 [Crotalaria pallida]|uniref:Uncharacterized protein n=1 Tax=Crotalaria pallida TaxID=3830 RepID=A0AAN9HVU1_CROPI